MSLLGPRMTYALVRKISNRSWGLTIPSDVVTAARWDQEVVHLSIYWPGMVGIDANGRPWAVPKEISSKPRRVRKISTSSWGITVPSKVVKGAKWDKADQVHLNINFPSMVGVAADGGRLPGPSHPDYTRARARVDQRLPPPQRRPPA